MAKAAAKSYKERVSKIAKRSTSKSSTPRIWTDHSGSSSVEAESLDIEDSRVLPRRTDGGQVTPPLAKLSNLRLNVPRLAGTVVGVNGVVLISVFNYITARVGPCP